MKILFSVMVAAMFFTLSCNKSSPKSPQKNENKITKAFKITPPKKTYRPRKIEGTLVLKPMEKDGQETTASLSLSIDEEERARGKITIKDRSFRLQGYRDKDSLRCWISPETPPAKVSPDPRDDETESMSLYGVLFAQASGNDFTGSISLSGHGGSPIFSGTFRESLK